MRDTILEVDSLKMARGKSFCLNIPYLRLKAGSILCITGPNGSGKTTFIQQIVGLLPAHNHIKIKQTLVSPNLYHVRAHVGYIPDDEAWLIKELSAEEYLTVLANIYAKAGVAIDTLQRARDIARALDFTDFRIRLRQLSHGNKKKVQIAAALMHEPEILVIDELRNGLDPLAIVAAEQLIATEAKRGTCIVATTHDLWWAERVADEIMLLSKGSVVLHRTVTDIQHTFGTLEAAFRTTLMEQKI